jgi:hypothetical protein
MSSPDVFQRTSGTQAQHRTVLRARTYRTVAEAD